MTGFFLQNAVAVAVGVLAGFIYYLFSSSAEQVILLTIIACGFLGVHLPNIQQPTLPSYRLIRGASWLVSLLVPMAIFFYRPTEFVLAWAITLLFTSGFWSIIDRISLQRDFTRSSTGIVLLPLMVTGCAYLALGQTAALPVFLACSSGYICLLTIEHLLQNRQQLQTNTQNIRPASNESPIG